MLNAISERFPVSRQAGRKHIGILHEAGLVQLERRGREKYCRIDVQPLQTVCQWPNICGQYWKEQLLALGKYLDE